MHDPLSAQRAGALLLLSPRRDPLTRPDGTPSASARLPTFTRTAMINSAVRADDRAQPGPITEVRGALSCRGGASVCPAGLRAQWGYRPAGGPAEQYKRLVAAQRMQSGADVVDRVCREPVEPSPDQLCALVRLADRRGPGPGADSEDQVHILVANSLRGPVQHDGQLARVGIRLDRQLFT
jgi:hypothetical protein